jgi:hypothetical protein
MNDDNSSREFDDDHCRRDRGRVRHWQHESHGHHEKNHDSNVIGNGDARIFPIWRAGL